MDPDYYVFLPNCTLSYIDHYFGRANQTYIEKVHVVARGFKMTDFALLHILLGPNHSDGRGVSIKAVEWRRRGRPHFHMLMLTTPEYMYMLHEASEL